MATCLRLRTTRLRMETVNEESQQEDNKPVRIIISKDVDKQLEDVDDAKDKDE